MDSSSSKDPPPGSKRKFPKMPFRSLGGDEDCDRPACADTVSAMNAAMARLSAPSSNSTSSVVECPPGSQELGRSSWNLLHSMAAWYPDRPSREDQKLMTNFMAALARFYPCTWCASDFQENLAKKPVLTSSREDLCMWLCEQHNLVNEKLGKDVFKCNMKNLDERWRKSRDPSCQSDH